MTTFLSAYDEIVSYVADGEEVIFNIGEVVLEQMGAVSAQSGQRLRYSHWKL